jgi:anaerobic magnesium-protoporphyrin IX monomethyl ester cyclase
VSRVLLIYPYFKPRRDRSVFRFPPLGIGYIAASVLAAGHDVRLLDCTFLGRDEALQAALAAKADVAGVYCMATMMEEAVWLACSLRAHCRLLVAGGPLPTCDPARFLAHFDVVVLGEGEEAMVELLRAHEADTDLGSVRGLAFRDERAGLQPGEVGLRFTGERPPIRDLDRVPRPARDLFPNASYIRHGREKYGYSVTTIMSTRGCPFRCEFCSNVIHGGAYRERSTSSVIAEIEEVLALGYDRISFADDVFTLNRRRVSQLCREIGRRGLRFEWECLGRVDALDYPMALEMKQAGCARIYFGIESASDRILRLMDKQITTQQARDAVEAAHRAGIQAGAFFILFYPGDTDDTVIETLRFAGSLPLDYLGLTRPYLLPGTRLLERVMGRLSGDPRPSETLLVSRSPARNDGVSEAKLRFAILKGQAEFHIKRRLGPLGPPLAQLFGKSTDRLLRLMR